MKPIAVYLTPDDINVLYEACRIARQRAKDTRNPPFDSIKAAPFRALQEKVFEQTFDKNQEPENV
jgi:hypothetical protein